LRQSTETLAVATRRGLTEITDDVRRIVRASGVRQGLCTVYVWEHRKRPHRREVVVHVIGS
jgi:thiamine phosphate synthase YjbQ (UPF0047 family)